VLAQNIEVLLVRQRHPRTSPNQAPIHVRYSFELLDRELGDFAHLFSSFILASMNWRNSSISSRSRRSIIAYEIIPDW
jgi:hypothetical protein